MSKTKNTLNDRVITITLNGEVRELPAGLSIADLLEHLSLVNGKVAVERNKAIAPRSQFIDIEVEDGDMIEIVRFVGGG